MKDLFFTKFIYYLWAFWTILLVLLFGIGGAFLLGCLKIAVIPPLFLVIPIFGFQSLFIFPLFIFVLWRKKLGCLLFFNICYSLYWVVWSWLFWNPLTGDTVIINSVLLVVWLFLSYLFYLQVKKERSFLQTTRFFHDINITIHNPSSHHEERKELPYIDKIEDNPFPS